ncbi:MULTISPECIES: nuclease-related domain-containing protein [unclassified Lysinibacillus]|uniref:nuclease-related domain-containing protein n=1 Tax=unclassified Lysinibacillus TaxID=2636778 RepID=UPI00382E0EE0
MSKYFFVLHNLVLANAVKHSHQLDTLFICNHFILVVEIKNISGKLDFDGITYQSLGQNLMEQLKAFQMLLLKSNVISD